MKQLRVLLLFILFFLLGGGTAYAQSVGDEAAAPNPAVQQEAVSVPGKNEARASSEQAADKKISKPVQETLASQDEKSKQVEPAAVETPEAEKDVTLEADAVDGEKQAAPEKQEDALDETPKTETAEEKEQVISDDKEEADDEKSANDLSEEGDSPVEADQEEKVKPEKKQTEESKASETEAEEAETDAVDKTEKTAQKGEVLEKGTVLDPQVLKASDPAEETYDNVKKVETFEELKSAIEEAGEKKTVIKIMNSFEITGTLTIKQGQQITLIGDKEKPADDEWVPIEQPKDYAKKGEKEQREIIDKARERGEKAREKADNVDEWGEGSYYSNDGAYYYNFDDKEIVLKRAEGFTDSMFDVNGELTLGDENNSVNFDGNKKKVTLPKGSRGHFFNVKEGGRLTLKNGVIANSKAEIGYSGAIKVHKGGTFTMSGGRISSNDTEFNETYPHSAGAVYVDIGGKFFMENGVIDHNTGAVGGVFVGSIFGAGNGIDLIKNPDDAAIVNMNGGYILFNRSRKRFISDKTRNSWPLAGGIAVFPGGTLNFNYGIVANNVGNTRAGGILVSDQYIKDSREKGLRKATTPSTPYDDYVRVNKAEANFKGGLIYKNSTPERGGGVFVDSNRVNFERVMILNNTAKTFGGGIYVSYAPRTQKLENVLITENHAIKGTAVSSSDNGTPGTGGGIWNCAYGSSHYGDGHSVYVYNNTSFLGKGSDYSYAKRGVPFELNGKRIENQFYIFLSPITKDHHFIKFVNDDGSGKPIPENMSYAKNEILLKAIYDDALKAEAWKNSGTFILGNESGNGAGYGSNADNYNPKDEGDVEFHFKKKWDEKIDKSEYENKDIHVDIFIVPLDKDEVYVRSQYGQDPDLYKYGEVVLNQGNNWQASFLKNAFSNYTLTKDNGFSFTKEELKAMGYKYLVMERETDYATAIEETNAEAPVQPGTVHISRDKTTAYGGRYDAGNHNADFYFYELNKDGTLSYIGKSTKTGNSGINAEFSHEILSGNIKDVVPYGKNRKLTEDERLKGWMGYSESAEKYSIFVEKTDNGIVLHVPYIWTEYWDSGASGIKVVKKDVPPVEKKDFYGYEFTLNNRPFTEAKIKKTWKMLTEEEIRQALGEHGTSVEVKNREIPDQVTFYILKDGERIVVDYRRDANGKIYPIYKTVTLTKAGGWQGVITKLDPLYLEKNRYGIEEEALEGFKMSYKLKKVLVDPRKDGEDEKDNVNITFRLSREYAFFSSIGSWIMKQPGYIPQDENETKNEEFFKDWLGNITVRLYVDGEIKEQKYLKWDGSSLNDDDLLFGYDVENPIIVDAKGHHIRVRYYNSMNENWGYHDPGYTGVNLFLKKDDKGVYTLYVPNMLVNGNFAKVFKVTDNVLVGQGKESHYTEITDFNPNPKNLEPYYEYIFEVTNTELPPERPPHNPPHEPPEEPEEPPVTPPEEPEEPPVIPPEEPEEPPVIPPEEPPVIPPKKPGESPQTGVGSIAPYMMLALSSSMGLGYIRRKKH